MMLPLTSRTAARQLQLPEHLDGVDERRDGDRSHRQVDKEARLPLTPLIVAKMTVTPGATAVTVPPPVIVATPVLLDCQVTARPVMTVPGQS